MWSAVRVLIMLLLLIRCGRSAKCAHLLYSDDARVDLHPWRTGGEDRSGGPKEGIMELGGSSKKAVRGLGLACDFRVAEIRAVGLPMCSLSFWRLDSLARSVM